MDFNNFTIPYHINPNYSEKVAYFSMEFAIEPSLENLFRRFGFSRGFSHEKCL